MQINIKTVLFQTIHFNISTQFSSIWLIDRTLSGATTPGQCEPGSDGNKGVLRIPQISSNTGTLPSDCILSYQDTSWGGGFTSLQICCRCIQQPQPTRENFIQWAGYNFRERKYILNPSRCVNLVLFCNFKWQRWTMRKCKLKMLMC